ncbi:hypothetical protein ACFL6I_21495 [candidate division KSB1 bacterium]
MFSKKEKNTFSLKPTKTFFSMLMIGIAVILIWRGVWNLLDEYLLPDHFLLSNIVGIVVGLLILYLPDKDIKELI